jgi:hypothetical protein
MAKKILKFIYIFLKKIIIAPKSWYFSQKINRGNGKIAFSHWKNKLIIKKGKNSVLQINGVLRIEKFHHFSNPVIISIAEGGSLIIEDDFILGEGIKINVSRDATLIIKGKKMKMEVGSHLTAC